MSTQTTIWTKLFIWNIDWNASNEDLAAVFAEYKSASDIVIVKDKMTWRSKWFWFVTFSNEDEAEDAIQKFNWYELKSRKITVSKAKPPVERSQRPSWGFSWGFRWGFRSRD